MKTGREAGGRQEGREEGDRKTLWWALGVYWSWLSSVVVVRGHCRRPLPLSWSSSVVIVRCDPLSGALVDEMSWVVGRLSDVGVGAR